MLVVRPVRTVQRQSVFSGFELPVFRARNCRKMSSSQNSPKGLDKQVLTHRRKSSFKKAVLRTLTFSGKTSGNRGKEHLREDNVSSPETPTSVQRRNRKRESILAGRNTIKRMCAEQVSAESLSDLPEPSEQHLSPIVRDGTVPALPTLAKLLSNLSSDELQSLTARRHSAGSDTDTDTDTSNWGSPSQTEVAHMGPPAKTAVAVPVSATIRRPNMSLTYKNPTRAVEPSGRKAHHVTSARKSTAWQQSLLVLSLYLCLFLSMGLLHRIPVPPSSFKFPS